MATTYRESVSKAVKEADMEKLIRYAYGGPCACMRREDEPLCVCRMFMAEIRRQIVPSGLKYGKIIRRDYEGKEGKSG